MSLIFPKSASARSFAGQRLAHSAVLFADSLGGLAAAFVVLLRGASIVLCCAVISSRTPDLAIMNLQLIMSGTYTEASLGKAIVILGT